MAVSSTVTKTNISRVDLNDGTVTVSGSSGGTHADAASRTFSYRLTMNDGDYDQSNATGSFTGLSDGTYTVWAIAAVSGADNINPVCTTSVSTQIINRPSVVNATVNKTNISCNTANDGTVTVSGTSGGTHADAETRTYSYRMVKSGGGFDETNATGSYTGLSDGTYTISVIAAASGAGINPVCTTEVATRVIFEPSDITGTASKTNVLCKDAADGTITVTSAGGSTHAERTMTYQYRLVKVGDATGNRTAQVSTLFSGLAPGTYNVYVIADGVSPTCEKVVSTQVITEPTKLESAPAVTSNYYGSQLSCPNSSDGAIAANASGGTSPYQYSWQKYVSGSWQSPGAMDATQSTITGVNAGSYRVTVTDANNCVVTNEVQVIPPPETNIVLVTKTPALMHNGRDVSCYGASDGTITVVAEGGTGVLQYSKDNGASWVNATGAVTPEGKPTHTFTGISAGSYTILVKDINGCNSDPDTISLSNPPLLEISSLVTNGPVNEGEELTFTATIVGGTVTETGFTYQWTMPRQEAQEPYFVMGNASGMGYNVTFKIDETTPDDNGYNTNYILKVTDANGCWATFSVTPIVYPSTIIVATTGNDVTGDGRSVNPLKTIQKAIDVSDPGDAISVQSGYYDESPVVDQELTIYGTSSTYLGTSSGSGPARYFVYGTTSPITWGLSWPTSVWDNLGMNASGAGEITTVLNKVNSNSSATLWMIGNISLTNTVTVSKQLAIRGATNVAAVPSYTGCDIAPPTTITFAPSGADTVLFKFTGNSTATKSLRDLVLEIPQGGFFVEVPKDNACNVDPVTNVRFDWDHDGNGATAVRRMYGVTNGSYSGTQKFDVAKLIYDSQDNNFGTGTVVFGNNGPLPWNSLEIGWKAEDGGVEVAGDKVETLQPMKGTVALANGTSGGRRPALNTTAGNYNGKWSMDFVAASTQYLEGNTSTEINGGSQKTLFVVFRPVKTSAHQVIYKHGDHANGMSLLHLSDGRISMNIYDGTTAAKRESWIFESGATHSATGFDNEVLIAQMYFNGNGSDNANKRVGAALDRESGRCTTEVNHTGAAQTNGYVDDLAFTSTTLGTPAAPGPANVVAVGARSGSMYYASWNTSVTPAVAADNSFTTNGRTLFYNGSIAEVLILNTASETARDAAYCYLRNKYYGGGSQSTANALDKGVVAGEEQVIEDAIAAWPTPADDHMTVEAVVPHSGNVTITMHDAVGRTVSVLLNEHVDGGTLLPVTADTRSLPSGAYMIRVVGAGGLNQSLPVIVKH
jgi:uncharacterized protein (DUF2141 family)